MLSVQSEEVLPGKTVAEQYGAMERYDEGASIIETVPGSRRAFSFLRLIVTESTMPLPGNTIHIPLPEAGALRLMLKVKPSDGMPRPGANPTKATRKPAKKAK